ncbi:MAG: uroporphyrinogen-III C-methyltransferase [Actinomycetota bacterium]
MDEPRRDRTRGLAKAARGVGRVALVGAGPGDPGLLTLKGRDLLVTADAVVYDRLAHPDLLDLAPPEAERIFIGKAYGRHVLEQEELNHLLIFLAAQGKRVVRLKGGDPFVYGRGGEEAEALAAAGIPFEIVPGVSSAVAAPAYAGIPITDRRYASSVAFVTGHLDPADPDNPVDWAGLGRSVDTLVIFMGLRQAGAIASFLVDAGRAPGTPVAVIEWGTYEEQRSLVSSLDNLAGDLAVAGFGSPSIIVVGEVVRLREKLAWFEDLACSIST